MPTGDWTSTTKFRLNNLSISFTPGTSTVAAIALYGEMVLPSGAVAAPVVHNFTPTAAQRTALQTFVNTVIAAGLAAEGVTLVAP